VKRLALALAALLSWLYRLIPAGLRRRLVMGLAVLESRIGTPDQSLRRLYDIEDKLELVINERAMALGGGEHPKHRLTDYHGFFATQVAANNPSNLTFVEGDATEAFPEGAWDVVVLSNVLEHIDDRIGFLTRIRERLNPGIFLIRVPLFERSWHMPMRREVGANFLSDPDHRIEHTRAAFEAEVAAAGFSILELQTPWGEIWARCAARP